MPPTDTPELAYRVDESPQAERTAHIAEPVPQIPFSEIPERAHDEGEGPYDGQDDGIVYYDVPEFFVSDPSYVAVIYLDRTKSWPKAALRRMAKAQFAVIFGERFTRAMAA